MARSVSEWVRHWDAKAAIANPVELNGYCVDGIPIPDARYREMVIDPSITRLEIEPGQAILEIGCGSGQILLELERRGVHCVGSDPSRLMLERFTGKSKTCLKAAHELSFEPGSFDRILLLSVAHYFPSMSYFADVIGRCLDWLRAPGIILIGDIPTETSRHNDYLVYDRHALVDLFDGYGQPYSLMAQVASKRLLNRRLDALIYKDRV